MTTFPIKRYDEIVEDAFNKIRKLGVDKGGEYAGDFDRLANFRRNGKNLGLPMETVWAVYAGKHWDALMQYIQDMNTGKSRPRTEPIAGRAHDLMVYLLLFLAMCEERNGPKTENDK